MIKFKIAKNDCTKRTARHCATCGCSQTMHEKFKGKCLALRCAMECPEFILCRHVIPPHKCFCAVCQKELGEQKEVTFIPPLKTAPLPKPPPLSTEEKRKKLDNEVRQLEIAGRMLKEDKNG